MTRHNHFRIHNDLDRPLVIDIEPEGACLRLELGDEVSVTETFISAPVTLKLSNTEDGELVLALWPGDGEIVVQKDGIDILDLVPSSSRADVHAVPNRV